MIYINSLLHICSTGREYHLTAEVQVLLRRVRWPNGWEKCPACGEGLRQTLNTVSLEEIAI